MLNFSQEFYNDSLNSAITKTIEFSLNYVTKIFVITVKGLEPAIQPLLILETRIISLHFMPE